MSIQEVKKSIEFFTNEQIEELKDYMVDSIIECEYYKTVGNINKYLNHEAIYKFFEFDGDLFDIWEHISNFGDFEYFVNNFFNVNECFYGLYNDGLIELYYSKEYDSCTVEFPKQRLLHYWQDN